LRDISFKAINGRFYCLDVRFDVLVFEWLGLFNFITRLLLFSSLLCEAFERVFCWKLWGTLFNFELAVGVTRVAIW